jgi:hypothetical protein
MTFIASRLDDGPLAIPFLCVDRHIQTYQANDTEVTLIMNGILVRLRCVCVCETAGALQNLKISSTGILVMLKKNSDTVPRAFKQQT